MKPVQNKVHFFMCKCRNCPNLEKCAVFTLLMRRTRRILHVQVQKLAKSGEMCSLHMALVQNKAQFLVCKCRNCPNLEKCAVYTWRPWKTWRFLHIHILHACMCNAAIRCNACAFYKHVLTLLMLMLLLC